ncbi:uncharacterized protein [Periplaneta americana]|uniref:uncharacterized protein isoform X1 n=1 Tax=Periplaneta americana TaxID=6978 RepID=UPI0037E98E7D
MTSSLVVAVTCLGVLGFSGHSSSLDVDLDGLKEVFLSSDVGLEPFTAAHLSRVRRNDEEIEEKSCCGDFNRDMAKKKAKLRRECYNSMKNRKFDCDKSKEGLQAQYCADECICKKQNACDGKGNVKPEVFKKECQHYFVQEELNDIVKPYCNDGASGANANAKGAAEQQGLKSCNLAAGMAYSFVHFIVIAKCPDKYMNKSEECMKFREYILQKIKNRQQ